jgi:hypothetical protein
MEHPHLCEIKGAAPAEMFTQIHPICAMLFESLGAL